MKPNLAYTLAFDPPDEGGQRQLAKMMVSSLLRTYFTGDVVLFRNSEIPLFQLERKGLEEVYVETPDYPAEEGVALSQYAMDAKFKLMQNLQQYAPMPLAEYDKILFLDADCLVLQNVDNLLLGDWDVMYQHEAGRSHRDAVFSAFWTDAEMHELQQDGINSGTWAVRASRYLEVMAEWAGIGAGQALQESPWTEQSAWNRFIQDTPLITQPFPDNSVQFPLQMNKDWRSYKQAHILHAMGTNLFGKGEFLFGMFMQRFYWEASGTFFNILEM